MLSLDRRSALTRAVCLGLEHTPVAAVENAPAKEHPRPNDRHSSSGACNRPGRAVAHLCVPDTRRSSTFPLCQSIFFACPCQRKPWMLFPDSPDLSPVFSRRAGPAHMPLAPWPTGLRRAHVMGQIPDAHRFPFRLLRGFLTFLRRFANPPFPTALRSKRRRAIIGASPLPADRLHVPLPVRTVDAVSGCAGSQPSIS
jgi:hypothetical protein